MERKIGEIFEYNGEWCQCVESTHGIVDVCEGCSFYTIEGLCSRSVNDDILGHCGHIHRVDDKNVIFKKLEKVGEPMEVARGSYFQRYQLADSTAFYEGDTLLFFNAPTQTFVYIEIKQNKEDMEEGKLDTHMEKVIDEAAQKLGDEISKQLIENLNKQRMKPFNLEDAKAGRPVCTRDGRKARIICFDAKSPKTGNIVTLVEKENGEEVTLFHYDDGHCSIGRAYALMMLPEKKEGWVNVYKTDCGIILSKQLYTSKEEAIKNAGIVYNRIDTVKISWEE